MEIPEERLDSASGFFLRTRTDRRYRFGWSCPALGQPGTLTPERPCEYDVVKHVCQVVVDMLLNTPAA
jgi:hypothetical protein